MHIRASRTRGCCAWHAGVKIMIPIDLALEHQRSCPERLYPTASKATASKQSSTPTTIDSAERIGRRPVSCAVYNGTLGAGFGHRFHRFADEA